MNDDGEGFDQAKAQQGIPMNFPKREVATPTSPLFVACIVSKVASLGEMKVLVSLVVSVSLSLCLCLCVFFCVCGLSDNSPATRATPMFVACIVSRGGGIGGKMKVLETHS